MLSAQFRINGRELLLYTVLLLILAVLLFGASAVIGALGYILGFIVAAVALVSAAVTFELAPIYVLMFGAVGFFALCGLVMLIAKLSEAWEIQRMKRREAR